MCLCMFLYKLNKKIVVCISRPTYISTYGHRWIFCQIKLGRGGKNKSWGKLFTLKMLILILYTYFFSILTSKLVNFCNFPQKNANLDNFFPERKKPNVLPVLFRFFITQIAFSSFFQLSDFNSVAMALILPH